MGKDMKMIDFTLCEANNRYYGGHAGAKKGIIYNGENWFLKFPKNTKNINKNSQLRSYASSPICEYIGSHIYNLLGITTHETILGIYETKVVVACRDFLNDGDLLYDYNAIKNDFSLEQEEILESISSSDYNVELEEVLKLLEINQTFESKQNIKKQFWQMFLVDAFINNNDRNSGNWGIISHKNNKSFTLAPVYDNGASFNSKLPDKKLEEILENKVSMLNSFYNSRICAFTYQDKQINPLKYIESMQNEELNKVILEIVPKINLDDIAKLINDIPNEYANLPVLSNSQKNFYLKSLTYIYDKVLYPTYKNLLAK